MTCSFPRCECMQSPDECMFKVSGDNSQMTKLGEKLINAAKDARLGPDFIHDNTKGLTAAQITSTEFPRAKLNDWLEKELQDNPDHPTNMYLTKGVKWSGCFVTDPVHGGKVTCHKCGGFIQEEEHRTYWSDADVPWHVQQRRNSYVDATDPPDAHFHKDCFNRYEHYYGLDRPID